MLDIKKLNTSAYRPQTDGLNERFNKTLEEMLSMYVGTQQKDWDRYLPFVEFAYNTSVQASIKETPFFLMYGRDPVLPIEAKLGTLVKEEMDVDTYKQHLIHGFKEVYEQIKYYADLTRQKQEQAFNKNQQLNPFKEGDLVWYFTPQKKKGVTSKLLHPWQGPFRIKSVKGPLNVEIQSV